MSIPGLIVRFSIIYILLFIASTFILNTIKANSGSLNTVLLPLCVIYACVSFGHKNGRYLSSKEKWLVLVGIVFVDIFVQVVRLLYLTAGTLGKPSLVFFISSLSIMVLIHAVVAYICLIFAKRFL